MAKLTKRDLASLSVLLEAAEDVIDKHAPPEHVVDPEWDALRAAVLHVFDDFPELTSND